METEVCQRDGDPQVENHCSRNSGLCLPKSQALASQAGEESHSIEEQSRYLEGSELATSGRVEILLGVNKRQEQGLETRVPQQGMGQPRETRGCYFLTWSPLASLTLLGPQGENFHL